MFGALCALSACGAPGDPVAPQPPVPEAVADLAARQSGDSVVLTFTLPQKTVDGLPLEQPPEVEIYRWFLPAGAPESVPEDLFYALPSTLVDSYLVEGRVRFVDPLKPEELERRAGEQVLYLVRTRASRRRASADSNLVTLRVYPVPEPLGQPAATLTETAIELRWTPPARTTGGASIASLGGYRVYRAQVETGEAEAADPAKRKLKTPLELLGVTPSASYRDTQFEFGRTYLYTVRSVAQYGVDAVESADSAAGVVTPRDTFAPAAPGNVVVVLVPTTPDAPAQLELSWSLSSELDLAGYHVYRSGSEGGRGERVNRELLLTPAFRDISVAPGLRYTYSVTAVDRAGNESPPSARVTAEVPAASAIPRAQR